MRGSRLATTLTKRFTQYVDPPSAHPLPSASVAGASEGGGGENDLDEDKELLQKKATVEVSDLTRPPLPTCRAFDWRPTHSHFKLWFLV